MSDLPYFSVVTPSFNQAQWIGGCIESVLAQGVRDFEHIVHDNCSTDGTISILEKYPHLRWRSEPDRGQAHAVNKGIGEARGEIICWLNADDQYPPGAFEIVRREFAKPGVEVIYGDAREVYFDGRPGGVRKARFGGSRDDFLLWWEKRQDLLQPAVFFTRRAAEAAGPLREDLSLILDTEYWSRLSQKFQFHYVPEVLAIQQRQPDSKTLRQTHKIYLEKKAVFEPQLREAYPGRRFTHTVARRRRMGWKWLDLARALRSNDPPLAGRALRHSLRENPFMLFSPTWWRCAARTTPPTIS
jgi:glycosyltransferase involved in cell wall biosynthesis